MIQATEYQSFTIRGLPGMLKVNILKVLVGYEQELNSKNENQGHQLDERL